MEKQTWGWNETIFILLLAFPLSVIHHPDWKQWARWCIWGTAMTGCEGTSRETFSMCTDNYSVRVCQLWDARHVNNNDMWLLCGWLKRGPFLPCVPAPGRCSTSLQHLWSPAHNSGSVCWEAAGPEPSPRPRWSSLYPRTPAAVETTHTSTQVTTGCPEQNLFLDITMLLNFILTLESVGIKTK